MITMYGGGMIERLEKLVRGVGIKIRYEAMDLEETIRVVGRFCKLRGKNFFTSLMPL